MCMEPNCHSSVAQQRSPSHYAARKKIWELEHPFHCSIIGTCLSLEELRDLCRKLHVTPHSNLSDYELHRAFVSIANQQSHATRRLNKYLDQKYRDTIRQFTKHDTDNTLEALWQTALESGELAGAYWALVTHPHISIPLQDRIYGEIHMLSHLAGATVRVDMQELNRLQRQNKQLKRQITETDIKSKALITERDHTLRDLNSQLLQTQRKLKQLQSVPAQQTKPQETEAKPSQQTLSNLQQQLQQAESNTLVWQEKAERAQHRIAQLETKLSELQGEHDALEASLEKVLTPDCQNCNNEPEYCINKDLYGRCILYVGGRSKQCAHFRALVEKQNGQFIHHDGGMNDGRQRLGTILPQADVVLCPLDCVSHDAANRVKQFCKRYGKQLVFLPRSSLAAFTRSLNELAA